MQPLALTQMLANKLLILLVINFVYNLDSIVSLLGNQGPGQNYSESDCVHYLHVVSCDQSRRDYFIFCFTVIINLYHLVRVSLQEVKIEY